MLAFSFLPILVCVSFSFGLDDFTFVRYHRFSVQIYLKNNFIIKK